MCNRKQCHLYIQRIKIPAQCATASSGRVLKIRSIYLALMKLNQKSHTPYRGRNSVCGFGFFAEVWGEENLWAYL